MQSISKLEQKTYDMNTITAADFTVEFDITPAMWDEFINGKDGKPGEYTANTEYKEAGLSEARAFKRELKKDVEREITKSLAAKRAKEA